MAAESASDGGQIGILSMGDMGAGIAQYLTAKGFKVATNCTGRSEDTLRRAQSAGAELCSSDVSLTTQCSIILSVVPPRDALATAQRVIDATAPDRKEPLYFFDLNAISPSTCRQISSLIEKSRMPIRFIDGCILGGPPKPTPNPPSSPAEEAKGWTLPSIPLSTPHPLTTPPLQSLTTALEMHSVSSKIASASALKMCFASLAKGFAAIAIQSFTTAHELDLLPALQDELAARLPSHWAVAQRAVVRVPPKAYRWVREMEEIDATFRDEAGFGGGMFAGAAEVFRAMAEDTVLGEEKIGSRKRGLSVEDVAEAMAEGLARKKKKME